VLSFLGQNVAVFGQMTSLSVPTLELQQLVDGYIGSGQCLELSHLQIIRFMYPKHAVVLKSILIQVRYDACTVNTIKQVQFSVCLLYTL
jgi:hypothetical protein